MKNGVLFVLSLCLMVSLSRALEFPSWNELKDVFTDLLEKTRDEESSTEDVLRMKREAASASTIGDESQNPYEVKSSSLPTLPDKKTLNSRYMPTVSNGHIGTTIYSDAIYMNGFYAGVGENSHRAKIPAIMTSRISLSSEDIERRATRKFIFHAGGGFFMETIDCEFAYIEHRIYTHQKFIRLYVSDVYARRKPEAKGGGVLTLHYPSLVATNDIEFSEPRAYYANWQVKGTVKSTEMGDAGQSVYIFYMDPLTQISLSGSSWEVNSTMIMSIDRQEANARAEFDSAQSIIQQRPEKHGHYQLLEEHVGAWKRTWERGRIEVIGDTQLAKITNFAQYYILSSLPAEFPQLPPQYSEIYHGCGRTSLAKGDLGRDYQGHVMWDNEMYIMPAVLPFHPDTVKKMLRYRSAMAQRAADNAKLYGGQGYHFPWQSAATGIEVAPNTCPVAINGQPSSNCHWKKYFVTAAVGWAIRQYYSMTRDRDYLINVEYSGCDMTREIAKFFADRAVYNPENARYDMANMTGPDDWHPNVKNNAFTLAAASLAIHWARYFACICRRNERAEVPDEWIQKAMHLNMPYDNVKRLHYQHQGFKPEVDRPIKQADTIMLTYPLNWNMSWDISKNDLQLYETMMTDKSPAMTWSFFTIGWKWVYENTKRNSYFLKSYQDYVVQPFKIWTEYNEQGSSDQEVGNVNFLPGMGAFLQSLVYGFAGVRIRPDKLEFHNPIPPPGATKLVLHGFIYLGSNMTFTIEAERTTIQIFYTRPETPLILRRNASRSLQESLTAGSTVFIEKPANGFFIYPTVAETCNHPRDHIYMPWGYSPWINSAHLPSSQSATVCFMALLSAVLVQLVRIV